MHLSCVVLAQGLSGGCGKAVVTEDSAGMEGCTSKLIHAVGKLRVLVPCHARGPLHEPVHKMVACFLQRERGRESS